MPAGTVRVCAGVAAWIHTLNVSLVPIRVGHERMPVVSRIDKGILFPLFAIEPAGKPSPQMPLERATVGHRRSVSQANKPISVSQANTRFTGEFCQLGKAQRLAERDWQGKARMPLERTTTHRRDVAGTSLGNHPRPDCNPLALLSEPYRGYRHTAR